MGLTELSQLFDLLYNNISSNQSPGLNEYEKSVLLTKALDEIVKNYFTPVQGGNKYGQGIEDSNKRYADFSCLIKITTALSASGTPLDTRGKLFKYPNDMMIPQLETYEVNGTVYQVVPLNMEEYLTFMSKPSSDPLRRQVWRLSGNATSGNGTFEIIPHWKNKDAKGTLKIKYIKQPVPIILEDLEEGLSINGVTTHSECELSPELHPEILLRAVELAKIFYLGQPADVLTAGQRSE